MNLRRLYRRFTNSPAVYFCFLFMIYSAVSLLNAYFPLYYRDGVGLTKPEIGLLSAIIPACAMFVSPVWGTLADRAKYKNTIVRILLAGLTVASFVFPLKRSFLYAAWATLFYGVFYTFIQSLSDAMIAETAGERGWDYGRIRLGGTFGYTLMCLVSGFLADTGGGGLFNMLSVIMAVSLIYSFCLPAVKGHRRARSGAGYGSLLKNKPFILILSFNFFYYLCMGYYYAFYAISLTSPQIGGASWMAGASVGLSALCEVFFLMNAKKIVAKLGIHNTLLAAAAAACLRWTLIGLMNSPWPIMAINMLHGFGHVVTLYCSTMFIAEHIAPELKASAQAAYTIVFLGVTRIISSVAGGFLAEAMGVNRVFLLTGGICAITAAAYAFLFRAARGDRRNI